MHCEIQIRLHFYSIPLAMLVVPEGEIILWQKLSDIYPEIVYGLKLITCLYEALVSNQNHNTHLPQKRLKQLATKLQGDPCL